LDLFVGRQPIFNRKMEVIGYELLYRDSDSNAANFSDGDHATSSVIINTFVEIGLDRLVGSKGLAFINLTRSYFTGELPLPLKHNRIVLEVLEDIVLDDSFVASVKELSENGYQIALDDVINPDDVTALLNISNIVKVDLLGVDWDKLGEYVTRFKKYNVKLLAEKVETLDEYNQCLDLGFDYFQGYFLAKPNIVKGKKLRGSRIAILNLLAKLQSNDIEFYELEKMISYDVSLSYKLLKLINSAFLSRGSEIQSIRQALTLLGLKQVRGWVSLLLLSETGDKPPELITTAMVRAKMCELLAKKANQSSEGDFIVGLFSVLDALLDISLTEVLSSIPLSPDIINALLLREGKMGEMLNCVLAYEKGQWESVKYFELSNEEIKDTYLDSIDWAKEVGMTLS